MDATRIFGRTFNGIFREIEREMDEIEAEMDEWMQRARKAGTTGSRAPLIYGWSLQIGPEGVPHLERFGNVGTEQEFQEALSEGWQAPYTTWYVDEDENKLVFTTDLPGIVREDIDAEIVEPDQIKIEAESDDRKYRTTCRMPYKLDPEKTEASFNNGVLELSIGLAEPVKPKSTRVEID